MASSLPAHLSAASNFTSALATGGPLVLSLLSYRLASSPKLAPASALSTSTATSSVPSLNDESSFVSTLWDPPHVHTRPP